MFIHQDDWFFLSNFSINLKKIPRRIFIDLYYATQ